MPAAGLGAAGIPYRIDTRNPPDSPEIGYLLGMNAGVAANYLEKLVISPGLLRAISQIDEFKGRWQALGSLAPDRLSALRRIATIESVGSSTRIEGAKLSDEEVDRLLSGLDVRSFRSRDEQEVAGYAEELQPLLAELGEEVGLGDGAVATGDIIVIHQTPGATEGPASETTSKTQYPKATYSANYDSAWDFNGLAIGITFSNRIIVVRAPDGTIQDAAPFYVSSGTPPAVFPDQLQALQATGEWLPANCGGAPCTYSSTPTAQGVSVLWTGAGSSATGNSVQRTMGSPDTNTLMDWSVRANSLGLPNP